MNHYSQNTRGRVRDPVDLPTFGLGGGDLGGRLRPVSDEQADETLRAAWNLGVRLYDTAPWYGLGASEHRVGRLLREVVREEFVLSTKVGRVLHAEALPPKAGSPESLWHSGLPFRVEFDYTYDGIMRSYEDSLERLGLAQVDILYVHDLDFFYHSPGDVFESYFGQLESSGWRALTELRDGGEVRAIGFGINQTGFVKRFAETFAPDVFLIAGPYTLMDQSGAKELDFCDQLGVNVVIGSPLRGGLLAKQTNPRATGAKVNADDQRAAVIAAVCGEFNVSTLAAALQFPLGHPAVVSLVVGVSSGSEIEEDFLAHETAIPTLFWESLHAQGILTGNVPTPVTR